MKTLVFLFFSLACVHAGSVFLNSDTNQCSVGVSVCGAPVGVVVVPAAQRLDLPVDSVVTVYGATALDLGTFAADSFSYISRYDDSVVTLPADRSSWRAFQLGLALAVPVFGWSIGAWLLSRGLGLRGGLSED
ncbi:MAG: hypothetical protein WC003_15500 [Terrimicrobiaceae bacterium]|nr:hypothetical protein [Terrimicrobiaceae bacterium]